MVDFTIPAQGALNFWRYPMKPRGRWDSRRSSRRRSAPGASEPAFLTPDGQPYVARENGGGQMAGAFNKIRDAAGLGEDVVPYTLRYTLRHTWATWFYA